MNESGINVRELITDILLSIDKGEGHSHLLIRAVLDKYDYLAANDKNLIKRVTEGTLEYRIRIDYIIDRFSKTPVKKMKPFIRNLMRMSVYQLIYMDKIPDSAVCNEAVKLAGKRGFKGLQGFVNGVLRNIARGYTTVEFPKKEDNLIYALSIEYSCPEEIVSMLVSDYGKEVVESALKASLTERPLYVRVDETLDDAELAKIKDEWESLKIKYYASNEIPYAYKLNGVSNIASLEGFRLGMYTVQDLSSMFVCEYAGIKAGDLVLDMCAAPGGKSTHASVKLRLAEKNGASEVSKGKVISRDLTDNKVDMINDNVSRLNATNIVTQVWDATVPDSDMCEKADVVIADVPCSGLGVIGRKPDIKYNLTKEGLESLKLLQSNIIDNAVRYVKPGGILMYSTCTMRKAENDANVKYILDKGGFRLDKSKQLFITEENDGFYIARLVKDI